MSDPFTYFDVVSFAALPYVALFTFFVATVQRYRQQTFTYSSLSSQFLENRWHFWGLVPFHFGIILILTAHVLAFLFPRLLLAWARSPLRLYALEVLGLSLGLFTLVGLVLQITRRFSTRRVRVVTSPADWLLALLLLLQVGSGVYVALFHPWGSAWFAAAVTPYLWSILTFRPDIAVISAAPFAVKLHVVNGFLLVLVFPFTRLVHILVTPNPYLWRKPQVVRWYR